MPLSQTAVDNLNANAQVLIEFQRWAEAENERIAENFTNAAEAYEKVDQEYKDKLNDPGREAAVDAIQLPAPKFPSRHFPSCRPLRLLRRRRVQHRSPQTQAIQWSATRVCHSKRRWCDWQKAAQRSRCTPIGFPGDWEGDAADAAFARMNDFATG